MAKGSTQSLISKLAAIASSSRKRLSPDREDRNCLAPAGRGGRKLKLELGAVSEAIPVTGDELHVNTEDATVSTIVDRNFAEKPADERRSFQTLIQLTPGVVVIPSSCQRRWSIQC